MRRCPICGGESGDRSLYCFTCGAPLSAEAQPAGLSKTVPQVPVAVVPSGAPSPVAERPSPGAVATEPEAPVVPASQLGGPAMATAPTAAAPPGAVAAALAARPAAPGGHAVAGTVVDGKYVIERVLGEGGMGVVYLARDHHTGVEVVLKALKPEIAHKPDARARTLSEGKALAQIDHANVVHLKAVVEEGAALWLVMQYIDGESLEQTIARYRDRRQPIPLSEVMHVFRQILAGVGAAHGEGLIHRDLKPANILIRRKDGVVKVSDFGIAKVEQDAQAGRGQTRGFIGSPHYTAPEQVIGRRDLDRRVDIYALGILLYEMLTGVVPFEAESAFEVMRMQVEEALPPMAALRPDAPRALDEIVHKACAKEREQRYGSCDELLRALEAALPDVGPRVTLDDEGAAPEATVRASPAPTAPVQQVAWAPPVTGPFLAAVPPTAPGTITGQSAALPAKASAGGAIWAVVGIGAFLLVVGSISLAALLGAFGGRQHEAAPSDIASPGETGAAGSSSTATPTATSGGFNTAEPSSALRELEGAWLEPESRRELTAVMVGDELEFRIVDEAQFIQQDYRKDEPRFVLRASPATSTEFLVEDRVRPRPPLDHVYDSSQSRPTCLASFTKAGAEPLRARVEGSRLTVEFAKVEPTSSNFTIKGSMVIGCVGLSRLRAERSPQVFERKR